MGKRNVVFAKMDIIKHGLVGVHLLKIKLWSEAFSTESFGAARPPHPLLRDFGGRHSCFYFETLLHFFCHESTNRVSVTNM